jgi:hypothetical protein
VTPPSLASEPRHLLRPGDVVVLAYGGQRARVVEEDPAGYVLVHLEASRRGQPIPPVPAMRPERWVHRCLLRRPE